MYIWEDYTGNSEDSLEAFPTESRSKCFAACLAIEECQSVYFEKSMVENMLKFFINQRPLLTKITIFDSIYMNI